MKYLREEELNIFYTIFISKLNCKTKINVLKFIPLCYTSKINHKSTIKINIANNNGWSKNMYNKFIFINNNKRKKQETQKSEDNSQISFDLLANAQNQSNNTTNSNVSAKPKSNVIFKTGGVKRSNVAQTTSQSGKNLNRFIDDYVLVDIETTGLSPIYDDIIEIGAIKVENNKMVDEYSQLIKIDRILPQKITELTGITDSMLATGKMPKTVLEEFVNFVGNNVIIGHNVNFDLGFLCNKCKKYLDYNLNNDYIDTLYLARKLVPNSINHKLGTLAKLFNISYEGAHRGLKDVEITYEVYNKLREIS